MGETCRAVDLLRCAQEVFDDSSNGLSASAPHAWYTGFASGGHWMRQALEVLRGSPLSAPTSSLNYVGVVKYGLASVMALTCLLTAVLFRIPVLVLLSVPAFYAVEAQMVFLFPLLIDGFPKPWRESRRWTRRAGGTLRIMSIVMPIAATMLLGGFAGRGFVRSWCIGCLAICIWYEILRSARNDAIEYSGRNSFLRLEFGSLGRLHIRREPVALGMQQHYRILYASDLHLGHWWTHRVGEELCAAAQQTKPHLTLLGGDLMDDRRALAALRQTIASLASIAPVFAIPGNHDRCLDLDELRDTIREEGGHWLLDQPIDSPICIDGKVRAPADSRPRILCAHYPSIFPDAVAAGYHLVLAGHLHGGQCVLATHRDRLYPAYWIHRWHVLRFTEQDSLLLVSRGAGDTFPFRLNCPREVILCEIT